MKRYGFIGLGIMGSAMAANLVRAGFGVTIWNRSAEKAAPLAALGARFVATPQMVVESSPVTFTMLADPAAAEAVCFGKYGILDGMTDGRGYVDMSTVDAATSRKIGAAVAAKGGRFLEAPVSGSRKPAEEGTLIILAAGDRTLYEEAMPAFEKMGKKIIYLGETGNGANMKLAVNMVMGGMMTMLAEGLALGEKAGLNREEMLQVIDAGAMSNPMFRMKGPAMIRGDFPPAFPLKHMQKDLRLALELGSKVRQAVPLAAAANAAFERAVAVGSGDDDFSAVYRVVKE